MKYRGGGFEPLVLAAVVGETWSLRSGASSGMSLAPVADDQDARRDSRLGRRVGRKLGAPVGPVLLPPTRAPDPSLPVR
jgi:hypothetical protein